MFYTNTCSPVKPRHESVATRNGVRVPGEAEMNGGADDAERSLEEDSGMRSLLPLSFVALALLVAGTWAVLARDGAERPLASEHATPVPETARTVVVSTTMPLPSAHERRLSAMLEAGAMPHEPTIGEVMSDTDCAPDATMISRCRNEVRLADGSTIVLRHPHDMRTIPCLAPEEQVLLVPAST